MKNVLSQGLRHGRDRFADSLRSERGSLLPTMLLLSVVIVILVTALSRRLWQGAAFTHAITSKNAATYIAESGIQVMLGSLRRSPNDTLERTVETPITGEVLGAGGGPYEVWVSSVVSSRVLIATATGVRGRTRQRIEALIELDNPGTYFGASMGVLNIAAGSTIQGKVYGTKVLFQRPTSQAIMTRVDTLAHYAPIPIEPSDYLSFVSTNSYVREPLPLNFPAIDPSQIAYYQRVAGTTQTWRGSDCPSKIAELGGLQPPEIGQPIYFVQGDCVIPADTRVQGQLILVSTGNIILAGDLIKETTPGFPSGIGLITPKDVVVQWDPDVSNVRVDAFIYAPQGTFYAERGDTPRGDFTFHGGYIVKSEPNIAGAFRGARTYTYDVDSLSLPLMPFRAEILQWRVRETERL